MASLQERDLLILDKEFKQGLLAYALAKTRNITVATIVVETTLWELSLKSKEKIEEVENLKAFTYGILKHQISIQQRISNPDARIVELMVPGIDRPPGGPVDPVSPKPPGIENKMYVDSIGEAIKKNTPELTYKVYVLRFIKGYEIEAVAETLGKSEGYIRQIIYDIRRFVRANFRNEQ